MDRRLVVICLTFISVAVGLLMANQWLSRQIDEFSHISAQTETVFAPAKQQPVPAKVKAMAIQPMALVEIDPKNDPLAPAVKAKTPAEPVKQKATSGYVKYDDPPRENILPQ